MNISIYILFCNLPSGSVVKKNPPANVGDVGLIPGLGQSPGEGNAAHSSTLAWKIPWTEEPAGLQSIASQESDVTDHACTLLLSRPLRIHLYHKSFHPSSSINIIIHIIMVSKITQRRSFFWWGKEKTKIFNRLTFGREKPIKDYLWTRTANMRWDA